MSDKIDAAIISVNMLLGDLANLGDIPKIKVYKKSLIKLRADLRLLAEKNARS